MKDDDAVEITFRAWVREIRWGRLVKVLVAGEPLRDEDGNEVMWWIPPDTE